MNNDKGNKLLWRYAGMGAEFIAGIGLGVFLGMKTDRWLRISIPLFVWILPLLVIVGMIIKIVIETSKKQE